MKYRLKQFLKQNSLLILSFFFMYIAPAIMLVILACEGKTTTVAWKLWGVAVGFILLIIYFSKFRKWIRDRKVFEKTEQLKIPVWLRIVDLLISVFGFFIVYLMLSTMDKMYDEILLYVICACISVIIGHLFLIVDSKKRESHRLNRN